MHRLANRERGYYTSKHCISRKRRRNTIKQTYNATKQAQNISNKARGSIESLNNQDWLQVLFAPLCKHSRLFPPKNNNKNIIIKRLKFYIHP